MSTPPVRQADVGLDRLLAAVLLARTDMRAALAGQPPVVRRMDLARASLLASLEAYASALTDRGLTAPPNLRDELALQRNLAKR